MRKTVEKIMDDIAWNCVYNCTYCDQCLKDVISDSKRFSKEQLESVYQCRHYVLHQNMDKLY